ncbi:DUF4376 domain-containing protein [Variovorax sp. EL159]|uniref:DUF4376 domain-containing protein n=1 Tax=Variovorax sp. EL159 TaxID=1566270 RepID=UPI00088EECAD|nr:DUF4376 domain-containing protein [Variovorax sp. EL159]SCX70911.1 protein of unknown function [Variovorax sp. EL159]
MPDYTAFDNTTGRVLARGSAPTEKACLAQALHPNEQILLGLIPEGHFVDLATLQAIAFPAQPSPVHVFDFATRVWVDPRTLEEKKSQLKADIAEQRWKRETAGLVLIGGLRVKTGREDRASFAEALADMESRGLDAIDFKTSDGFVTLTAKEARGISRAVSEHVQACFYAERAACAFIDQLSNADIPAACDLAEFVRISNS